MRSLVAEVLNEHIMLGERLIHLINRTWLRNLTIAIELLDRRLNRSLLLSLRHLSHKHYQYL